MFRILFDPETTPSSGPQPQTPPQTQPEASPTPPASGDSNTPNPNTPDANRPNTPPSAPSIDPQELEELRQSRDIAQNLRQSAASLFNAQDEQGYAQAIRNLGIAAGMNPQEVDQIISGINDEDPSPQGVGDTSGNGETDTDRRIRALEQQIEEERNRRQESGRKNVSQQLRQEVEQGLDKSEILRKAMDKASLVEGDPSVVKASLTEIALRDYHSRLSDLNSKGALTTQGRQRAFQQTIENVERIAKGFGNPDLIGRASQEDIHREQLVRSGPPQTPKRGASKDEVTQFFKDLAAYESASREGSRA